MSRSGPRTVSSATSVRKRHRPVLCSAFTRSCNFQPTAPLRRAFDVDLRCCAAAYSDLRQPEPWLSLVSLGFMTRPALIAIPVWNRAPVFLQAMVIAELIDDVGGVMPDIFMVANR